MMYFDEVTRLGSAENHEYWMFSCRLRNLSDFVESYSWDRV
jgi:hypothetical protein